MAVADVLYRGKPVDKDGKAGKPSTPTLTWQASIWTDNIAKTNVLAGKLDEFINCIDTFNQTNTYAIALNRHRACEQVREGITPATSPNEGENIYQDDCKCKYVWRKGIRQYLATHL